MRSLGKIRDWINDLYCPNSEGTRMQGMRLVDEAFRELEDRYMRKPLDLDDEPIYVGERIEASRWPSSPVETFTVAAIGVDCVFTDDGRCLALHDVRGHRQTVEDVLREFVDALDIDRCEDFNATIAEYAAKLRLASEDE
jgi:hypothetical protein